MESSSNNCTPEDPFDDDISLIMAEYSMPFVHDDGNISPESLTRSIYGKVVFHDIADSYPTDADVCCRYSLTSEVQVQEGDYIAIFRVGWKETDDAILKHPAFVPDQPTDAENGTQIGTVLFRAEALPKDEHEFYQLCYMTSDGSVCGASVPFQFRRPHEGEFCCDETQESEMVVIRSSTAIADEKFRKVQQEKDDILREKGKLLSQLKALKMSLLEEEVEKSGLKKEIETLKTETEELKDMLEAGRQRERQVTKLQQDMQVLDEGRSQVSAQLHHSKQHIEMLTATVDTLSADKARMAGLLRESVKRADDTTVQLEETRSSAKNLEERFYKFIASQAEEREKENLNRGSEIKNFQKLEESLAIKNTYLRKCEQELAEAKAIAQDAERQRQDLGLLREHRANLEQQLHIVEENHKRKLAELRGRELDLIGRIALLTKQLSETKQQLAEANQQLGASSSQNRSSDCEQCEAAGIQISLLEAQVKDLRLRLEVGADEYRKIYVEKHRAERKLSKSRSGSKQSSPKPESPSGSKEITTAQVHAPPSTSKSSGIAPQASENEQAHNCPMCGVTFPPGSSDLFTKHFDNHLS